MKSRYCYCPATAKRIGKRMTLLDRIRRNRAAYRMSRLELYPISGYYPPVYPGK